MFKAKRNGKTQGKRAGILLSILLFLAFFLFSGCGVTTLTPDPDADERVTAPDQVLIREDVPADEGPGGTEDPKITEPPETTETPEILEDPDETVPDKPRDVFATGTQFRNKDRFEEHYEKHVIDQQEFGDITREEYMALAQDLVDSGRDGILSKVDEDKNTLYYDPETNSFAVVSKDGYIRTFFKPAQGQKYYDRQK